MTTPENTPDISRVTSKILLGGGPDAGTEKPQMSMSAWLATDGGRRCPMCGKFSKADELGFVGGTYETDGIVAHISAYGHLPGYGCNR